VSESQFFFEVVQINNAGISSKMRPSAKLNANGKLWVFATVEVGEFCYIFLRRSQLAMAATDFML